MIILIKGAQLILSLSILVVLHELGHFLPAKFFKTRVEKFYLFFNPWFSLFKIKRGETEYGIGWLPLGGYVKIAGMIDESMDKEQMAKAPEPWEFRSKPAWQRLIIMIGGVTVNLLLGIFIYIMISFVWGKQDIKTEAVKYGVHCDPLMTEFGFEEGDKIVKIGDVKPQFFTQISKDLLLNDPKSVTVERNGALVEVPLPEGYKERLLDEEVKSPFAMRIPFVVDSVIAGLPAEIAGIQKGDSIIRVNAVSPVFFGDAVEEFGKHKGEDVEVEVIRNGQPKVLAINVSEEGRIGVGNKSLESFLEVDTLKFTFTEAIGQGINTGISTLTGYVSSLKLLFSASGAKQMGGFGSIGGLFPSTWDWQAFWGLTAFLSIVLAFMNILPIPALDGGHVLFLIYEMVAGKAPSDKFLEYAQIVGMVFLVSLMLFANGNDVFKHFFK